MSTHQADELERYPGIKNIYLKAFEKMLQVRLLRHKDTEWRTAQEVYEWWVSKHTNKGKHITEEEAQEKLDTIAQMMGRTE